MTTPSLPPPRDPGTPYRIALVCLGNICRSPMADVVLNDRLERAGLDRDVEVSSAGTGGWHVGNPMDRRAAALLTAHGYDASRHQARQFGAHWFTEHDLVLAMDESNLADLVGEFGDALDEPERLMPFRAFDPRARDGDPVPDVPDPFYGGPDGFDEVLAIVERSARALVRDLGRTA
jgi:protein-tyrosine phosphatase